MLKYALLPILMIVPAWSADTTPTPPACLAGPVTQGNVTITCSLLDNTAANGASALGPALVEAIFLQVRVTSTDPEVIAFRIGLSVPAPVSIPPPAVLPPPVTLWGFTGQTFDANNKIYFATLPTPGFRYRFGVALGASQKIISIQVQELKPSSSQTF